MPTLDHFDAVAEEMEQGNINRGSGQRLLPNRAGIRTLLKPSISGGELLSLKQKILSPIQAKEALLLYAQPNTGIKGLCRYIFLFP